MVDLKPGDIKEFWGYGPCVILDVTPDNYYVLNNYGMKDLIPKTMEYKTVQLDKEHRTALYNYYLVYADLCQANKELGELQLQIRKGEKLLEAKAESIAKKYGDMSYEDFIKKIKIYGEEYFKKLESFGYKYSIEEMKGTHSLRIDISLCRPVKLLRQNPDYIKADYDDSALIVETKQYNTDLNKYSDMYCVDLFHTLSTSAMIKTRHNNKKLEMTVGPLYLLHSIEVYTPFIHYTDKVAKAVAEVFKTK